MAGPLSASARRAARCCLLLACLAPVAVVWADEPSAAGRLHLSRVSPDLSDTTLDLVVSKGDGASEVRAYATLDAPEVLGATALFLARGYVAICKRPRVTVVMVRGDLPWAMVARDMSPGLITAADAVATAADESAVRIARRLPPKRDVEAAVFHQERVQARGAGVAAEKEALGDVAKRFRLAKTWRPPSGDPLVRAIVRDVADDASAFPDVARTIRGTCKGYDGAAPRGR
ncbi:hypothetical protein [Hansschlegelia sp. KR7-227]|uniref:hypothetical protein n=1 Tax=Hansschlegelia sp. KR7-227 TaxID=3400914 RepID=UPI003BFECDAA